ncbi:hypothetical protein SeMB42_g07527 [Synchytrium endobioticum]|uniref:Uncharacterized protein n=1 Tax=Synchytrium endobioticum TaxID=286115 RepID=A0A507C040_9FUNG|nr:hypothetical protein SeMB42_g07527 [Synchytrium endobioticum]TPX42203.1 hypothetical protein SeLEV6574_g05712 [Synchytrium endobioticum]
MQASDGLRGIGIVCSFGVTAQNKALVKTLARTPDAARFGISFAAWNASKARCDKTGRGPAIWHAARVMECVARALGRCVARSSTLTSLDLVGLPLGPKTLVCLGRGIAANKSIRRLSLANSRFGDAGFKAVAPGLKASESLKSINLAACNLTVLSASILAELLKSQAIRRQAQQWKATLRFAEEPDAPDCTWAHIRRLNLSCNLLGDEGCEFLADALRDELGLRALDLQFNDISDRGGRAFQQMLDFNRQLVLLDLRNNHLDPVLHHLLQRRLRDNNAAYAGATAHSELPDSELMLLPAHDALEPAFHVSLAQPHAQTHTHSSLAKTHAGHAHAPLPVRPRTPRLHVPVQALRPAWRPAGSTHRWIPPRHTMHAVALRDPLRADLVPPVPDNTRAGSDWDVDSQSHMAVGDAIDALRGDAPVLNNRASNDPRARRETQSRAQTVAVDLDTSVPPTMVDSHSEVHRGVAERPLAFDICRQQDLSCVINTIEKSFKGLSMLLDELERKRARKLLKKAMKNDETGVPSKVCTGDTVGIK